MQALQINKNPEVDKVFVEYPDRVRPRLLFLRKLIIETAKETEGIMTLEETLKWGEPSYLTKYGSTIRIDWKPKTPDQYAVYFKCTSQLVPTFRKLFKDSFTFETNRAIVFTLSETVPSEKLKKCLAAALTYHKVKHLPMLNIQT